MCDLYEIDRQGVESLISPRFSQKTKGANNAGLGPSSVVNKGFKQEANFGPKLLPWKLMAKLPLASMGTILGF